MYTLRNMNGFFLDFKKTVTQFMCKVYIFKAKRDSWSAQNKHSCNDSFTYIILLYLVIYMLMDMNF